jgi:2-methylcitrate dehydratase
VTDVEKLARFVQSRQLSDISPDAVNQLKIRILDTLGVAIGALDSRMIRQIREHTLELGGPPLTTLIGGPASSPDRAAFFNGALVRYLDFNDSFLAPNETCHPSDNLAPVLAAAEYSNASGKDFLTALAVAYQVQIRLSELAPVRSKGFDHTTQGAFATAAGIAKALGLDQEKTANAIAINGTSNYALRVTRTGHLSQWKGLAYPHVAMTGIHSALLAMRGITGPLEVFEGNKGFQQTISGPFLINWDQENLEGVRRTILKKYNAEIHSQSAIETALDLKNRYHFKGSEIERIHISIFQVAFDIIGGGEEGAKTSIQTKEEADHSLPYVVAVALLDGNVLPEQYEPGRIIREDVQTLLQRVFVKPDPALSSLFPKEVPVHINIILKNGLQFNGTNKDYEGFLTRPMSWSRVKEKFRSLAMPFADSSTQDAIVHAVENLDTLQTRQLTSLLSNLGQARRPHPKITRSTKMTKEGTFSFIPMNSRADKPRLTGLTEIRGPYYSPMGTRYLSDLLETMGQFVDGLKFAGGSFALMPRDQVKNLIQLAHQHQVYVSTGGWIERVMTYGPDTVNRYIDEVFELGFDVVELSMGFITLPTDDLLRLIEKVTQTGLKAKPELGIQFGAGGATSEMELAQEGTRDVRWLITQGQQCLKAGASIIMIESEGITESVKTWRTDVVAPIIEGLGLDHVMFEAADPAVFEWYVKNYGSNVNLFVDHSQIVQLEALRSGIWGTKSTWGRIASYPATSENISTRKKKPEAA